jgi:tetratricopeptide (TPR) repeat protein
MAGTKGSLTGQGGLAKFGCRFEGANPPRNQRYHEDWMNLSNQTPAAKTPDQEAGLLEWFLDVYWPKFGKQTLYGLILIAVAVSAVLWYKGDRVNQLAQENKQLGPAYIFLGEDKADSAEAFLTAFVKNSHSRLVQDKAYLMLGQIAYGKGKFDEAIAAFSKVDLANTDLPLIASGALHGLASSHIQKKDYAKAVENLEALVSRFGRKTGNPSENLVGKEVVDLAPTVPNALWKLALSYRELKNPEKSKAAAAKLAKVYPDSREAYDAKRLMAQLP